MLFLSTNKDKIPKLRISFRRRKCLGLVTKEILTYETIMVLFTIFKTEYDRDPGACNCAEMLGNNLTPNHGKYPVLNENVHMYG